jgi:hypothetical protein
MQPIILETLEDALQNHLEAKGLKYYISGFKGETDYDIEGFTYNVSVYIREDGAIYCETIHQERFRKTDDITEATGNRKEFKKIKSALNYIDKWTDC